MPDPLVTCICPTMASRTAWLPRVLACFAAQTYRSKELLFVGGAAVRGALLSKSMLYSARFLQFEGVLGHKRNAGVQAARGEVIVHFDDDDYSAPGRIADQVERLTIAKKAVSGYHTLSFTDGNGWWQYLGLPNYALGTSLCYRREWAIDHPFPGVPLGEDTSFVSEASAAGELVTADGTEFMHATNHPGNTSPRSRLTGSSWRLAVAPSYWKAA